MRVSCFCALVTVACTVRRHAVTVCRHINITYHVLGICHGLWHTPVIWYVVSIWQDAMTASPDCNCTVCMRVECMCAPVTVARTVKRCSVTVCRQNNITYHIYGVCHGLWHTPEIWYVMLIWQNPIAASSFFRQLPALHHDGTNRCTSPSVSALRCCLSHLRPLWFANAEVKHHPGSQAPNKPDSYRTWTPASAKISSETNP